MTIRNSWRDVLREPARGDHMCKVYRDPESLVDAVAEYLGAGLRRGEAGLVIATPGHANEFRRQLLGQGCHAGALEASGQLVVLDAEATLARIAPGGRPDWEAFRAGIGPLISTGRRSYPAVRAYSEMVNLLWQRGRREAAMELESFSNRLAAQETFSLLCAYQMDVLDADAYGGALQHVCEAHTHLIPACDYAGFDSAVQEASERLLDRQMSGMLFSLARSERPRAHMPDGQAVLLWAVRHMPVTAAKLLERVRGSHARSPA